jgi:hypothetical protein
MRNAWMQTRFAALLGLTEPEGEPWEVFFVPTRESMRIDPPSARMIVRRDDLTSRCGFEL